MSDWKLVIVESPFAGDVERNKRYLERCLRDCIGRGESPYASHKMLTDCLDDTDPDERRMGIEAGFAWKQRGVRTVFYEDLGWSNGMNRARELCQKEGVPFEVRTLPRNDPFWKTGPARTWLLQERERWFRMAGDIALVTPSPAQVQSMLRRVDWALGEPESRTEQAARELGWHGQSSG